MLRTLFREPGRVEHFNRSFAFSTSSSLVSALRKASMLSSLRLPLECRVLGAFVRFCASKTLHYWIFSTFHPKTNIPTLLFAKTRHVAHNNVNA